MYPARVVLQNADGLLEVVPDDTRLPGITNVPIRYGIPCVSAKIRAGSRVLIGFENGNPKAPVATVWDTASVESIVVAPDKTYIGGDSDEAHPIARVGDMVECLMPPLCPVTGTVGGAPFVGMITIVDVVMGTITSGASKGFSE
jgi:hypothetical protein